MKFRRTLPRQTPPFVPINPQCKHRKKERDVDYREDEPGVLELDLISQRDTSSKIRDHIFDDEGGEYFGGLCLLSWLNLRIE
jgi:hypothetical protein